MRTILILGLCWSLQAIAGDLPDPKYTPGAIDASMSVPVLCSPTFRTTKIRPPVSYTNKLKATQLASYYKGNDPDAEEDHLIPLWIGGAPRDPRNLWPQSWNSFYNAKHKDKCEDKLHRMVCSGKLSLKDAQTGIARNWIQFCGSLP